MPTPTNKTNFKTYDAVTRLLAAVIATNQGKIRLDFKAIATHMGGGTGKDAVNHRLRPIKALAKMMSQYVAQNKDPGDLKMPEGKGADRTQIPKDEGEVASLMGGGTTAAAVDHRLRPVKQLAKLQLSVREQKKDPGDLPIEGSEIQKLFGESTAGGIEWQFRDIKSLGRRQQEAVSKGKNPAELKVETPSRGRAPKANLNGGTKRKRASGGAIAKRKMDLSDEDDDSEPESFDYDAKDVHSDEKDDGFGGSDDDSDVQFTPTPTPASKRTKLPDKPMSKTPSRTTPGAKKNGGAAPAKSTVQRSLFGNGTKRVVDDDEIQVVDLSEDHPVRKMPARSSRIKADPQPMTQEEEFMGLDPSAGSNSLYSEGDDYVDGEC
ncbi:hypothetical protein F4821DRAFT_255656 [Hypoxylon rubiginosum]|uniref:Uncharacterized protein n=1 Tax=Hypoxylon rubiginosum TaxID=110542 RepID=A0ACC0DDZ5_9PEZI|nr:hypothetical protein F4821DRAFT_255656 [Hypoxylon rubiginosum]